MNCKFEKGFYDVSETRLSMDRSYKIDLEKGFWDRLISGFSPEINYVSYGIRRFTFEDGSIIEGNSFTVTKLKAGKVSQ